MYLILINLFWQFAQNRSITLLSAYGSVVTGVSVEGGGGVTGWQPPPRTHIHTRTHTHTHTHTRSNEIKGKNLELLIRTIYDDQFSPHIWLERKGVLFLTLGKGLSKLSKILIWQHLLPFLHRTKLPSDAPVEYGTTNYSIFGTG